MKTATFKEYQDGYFTFIFDEGMEIDFEEVHPKVLYQYDLKNDPAYIDREFKLTFSEVYDRDDDDSVTYRIERLVLVD